MSNLKILLGTNTFGEYHRQTVAMDSLRYLKEKFPDIVELIDVQFKDEQKKFTKNKDFDTVFELSTSSLNWVKGGERKFPIIQDIIRIIYENAKKSKCDYFIYTNSDVIIMPNLIHYINENRPTSMACSRLDIKDIPSFQSVLDQQVSPVRYEIAGFDTFVFKLDWYEKHEEQLQQGVYFMGKPLWDVILAGKMKILGDNTPLGNNYPPFCFHIHHGIDSVTTECPEKTWVEEEMKRNPFDGIAHNIMFAHLKMNLLRRQPWGAFLNPAPDEKEFERNYFNLLNLHTEKRI